MTVKPWGKYRVCRSGAWVTVWEPTEVMRHGNHHGTIAMVGDRWYGRLGTRVSGCALPAGVERSAVVDAHYKEQYSLAYCLGQMVYAAEIAAASKVTYTDGEIGIY